jgi:hypothetical protein
MVSKSIGLIGFRFYECPGYFLYILRIACGTQACSIGNADPACLIIFYYLFKSCGENITSGEGAAFRLLLFLNQNSFIWIYSVTGDEEALIWVSFSSYGILLGNIIED